jgi:hypothetical protein
MASTPTLARAYGSRVQHLLVPGTKTTRCGKDATLMARYSPADNRVDSKVRPTCTACRKEA